MFFLQIDTNTQDTDTKTLTAECWPSGPALNCTSFGRRSTNKYTHATATNIYQMECTKKKNTKELLVETVTCKQKSTFSCILE